MNNITIAYTALILVKTELLGLPFRRSGMESESRITAMNNITIAYTALFLVKTELLGLPFRRSEMESESRD